MSLHLWSGRRATITAETLDNSLCVKAHSREGNVVKFPDFLFANLGAAPQPQGAMAVWHPPAPQVPELAPPTPVKEDHDI